MMAVGLLSEAEGAWQLSLPRHAPELKWIFGDLLLSIVVMGYTGFVAEWDLVGFGDDEADAFHQFMLALKQRFACGMPSRCTWMHAEIRNVASGKPGPGRMIARSNQ